MKKPFLIAEIGINHNGDLNIAKKLIDCAVNAAAITTITGTVAATNTAYSSSGITGLGNEAIQLTNEATQSDLISISSLTTGDRYIQFPEDQIWTGDSVDNIFVGDTLFSGGCGRIFEGTYEQMFASLEKIKLLPTNTLIYCAHEYTKSNLVWALNLNPEDQDIKNKLLKVEKKIALKRLTIPFKLDEEMKINLFLRAKNLKEFIYLRANKDLWA